MLVTPRRLAIAVLLLVATVVSAEDFFVVYVEGSVEHQMDGRWVESVIGDTFPAGTEVRLGDDGFLEVVLGNRTIRYAQEGTYQLGDAAGPSASGSNDLGGLIRGTVSRFNPYLRFPQRANRLRGCSCVGSGAGTNDRLGGRRVS
jgi:hypothetical protein